MNSYLIEYNEKIIGSYSDYNNAELFILSCYQNNLMTKDAYIHCYKINSCYKVNTNIVTINNNSSSECDISLHVLTPHTIPESPTVSLNTKSDKENDFNSSADKTPNETTRSKNEFLPSASLMAGLSPLGVPQNVKHSDETLPFSSKEKDKITLGEKLSFSPNETVVIKPTITPEMKLKNEKLIDDIEKEKHNLIHNMNLLKLQQNKISEAKQVFDVDLKLFNQFKAAKETDNTFVIPELFVNKYKIMNKLFLEDKLDWSNYYYNIELNNKGSNMYDEHFITNSYENSFINNKNADKNNKIDEEIYLDI